jgi:uncharacterized membrane protein
MSASSLARAAAAPPPSRTPAVLAYLPVVGWLFVLVLQRQNPLAMFHLKQAIGLVLFLLAVFVGWVVVAWVLAWIPFAFVFGIGLFALVIVAYLAGVVILLMGLRNALNAQQKPLPIFGEWASRMPI